MTGEKETSGRRAKSAAAAGESGESAVVAAAPRDPLGQLRIASFAAIVVSAVSLVAALTVPLWGARLYGNPTAIMLGMAQLRPALQGHEPLRPELALLTRIAPRDAEVAKALETLAAYADRGVPTLPELKRSFLDTASAICIGDDVADEHSWYGRALVWLAASVHFHAVAHQVNDRIEHKKGAATEVVWAAQQRLDADDLAGAVAALGKLNERQKRLAAPWIRDAQSRLAADRLLQLLDTVARDSVSYRWFASN